MDKNQRKKNRKNITKPQREIVERESARQFEVKKK